MVGGSSGTTSLTEHYARLSIAAEEETVVTVEGRSLQGLKEISVCVLWGVFFLPGKLRSIL